MRRSGAIRADEMDRSPHERVEPDRDLFGRVARRTPDWSHRRGEPRVFAFCWTLYLMGVVTLLFVHSGALSSFSYEAFRRSSRLTMLMLVLGVCVLWPMVRLSQATARSGGVAVVARDLVVLLVPAQALIWPQVWLSAWSLEVVLALFALLCVWALLIGGILAIMLGGPAGGGGFAALQQEGAKISSGRRLLGLGACVLACVVGSVLALLHAGAGEGSAWLEARPLWMLSPFLGVLELTRERPWLAVSSGVGRIHWLMVAALGVVALGVWVVCGAIAAGVVTGTSERAESETDHGCHHASGAGRVEEAARGVDRESRASERADRRGAGAG